VSNVGPRPVSLLGINNAIGGGANLLAQRGRTLYNSGGGAVVISQQPSLIEFENLTNIAPINARSHYIQVTGTFEGASIQINYRPRTGELWLGANNGTALNGWGAIQLINPADYQSLAINYSLHNAFGPWFWRVDQNLNPNDPNSVMIYSLGAPNGIGIGMDIWLSGNGK
jgi:hypothetical protein